MDVVENLRGYLFNIKIMDKRIILASTFIIIVGVGIFLMAKFEPKVTTEIVDSDKQDGALPAIVETISIFFGG